MLKKFTGIVEFPDEIKALVNNKPHREDGEAVEKFDGSKYWYLNEKRVDKQVVELYYILKYKRKIKP